MNILDDIKEHILSVNKFQTLEYLDTKEPVELLTFCHPLYLADYARRLKDAGYITLLESSQFAR